MIRRILAILMVMGLAIGLLANAAVFADTPPATAEDATVVASSQGHRYEVWAVDQADAANGGDALYIWTDRSWTEPYEVLRLGERAARVGDGAGVRPHLLLFNNAQTHALLANVASGHVYVIRASDRSIVASIDVGEQAHGAMASADDRWILVANQNGKKLARLEADFQNEVFRHDPSTDLDLGALENPNQPDNAPICPVMFVGPAGKAYVTLRGGGMYVVDVAATPMQITRQYTRAQVAPAGCGGIQVGDRVWVNSGTASSSNLYLFDANTDDLLQSWDLTQYGTDAHGMAYVGGRYLWMANRADGDNILVIDTWTNELVNILIDVGPAPDLMDLSPDGSLVFVTLRGPNALTGGAGAIGITPGISVMEVLDGGASGRHLHFIPIGAQTPDSHVDPHTLAVRRAR